MPELLPSYLPAQVAWPDIVTGDTFPDLPISMVDADGSALSPALARVLLVVKTLATDADADAVLTRDSDAGHITISDAANWQFSVNEFTVALAAGEYPYKLVTIASDGDRRTWLAGIWHIAIR